MGRGTLPTAGDRRRPSCCGTAGVPRALAPPPVSPRPRPGYNAGTSTRSGRLRPPRRPTARRYPASCHRRDGRRAGHGRGGILDTPNSRHPEPVCRRNRPPLCTPDRLPTRPPARNPGARAQLLHTPRSTARGGAKPAPLQEFCTRHRPDAAQRPARTGNPRGTRGSGAQLLHNARSTPLGAAQPARLQELCTRHRPTRRSRPTPPGTGGSRGSGAQLLHNARSTPLGGVEPAHLQELCTRRRPGVAQRPLRTGRPGSGAQFLRIARARPFGSAKPTDLPEWCARQQPGAGQARRNAAFSDSGARACSTASMLAPITAAFSAATDCTIERYSVARGVERV